MGDDAVPRSEDVGEVGPHLTVDGDRAHGDPVVAPADAAELGVRADTDHYEDHVDDADHTVVRGVGRLDAQSAGRRRRGRLIGADRRPGTHVDAAVRELAMYEGTDLGIDGREHLGELFHLGHLDAPPHQRFGHLEPDVACPDDDGARWCEFLESPHHGEGVAHGVQQVDTVVHHRAHVGRRGPQSVGGPARRPVPRSARRRRGAPRGRRVFVTSSLRLATSMRRADVSRRRPMPVASRSAMVLCARLRQSVTSPRDVVGDPTDGEVRIGVGDNDGDFGVRIEFTNPKCRADARVASSDCDDVHVSPMDRLVTGQVARPRWTATAEWCPRAGRPVARPGLGTVARGRCPHRAVTRACPRSDGGRRCRPPRLA